MRKLYNERHTELENRASDLDILKELKKRGALNDYLQKALEYLKSQEAGLNILLEQLNSYAKEHWVYMTNVSLSHDNTLNCQFLLMTSTDLYTFEIIHHGGLYELEQGNESLNGEILDYKAINISQNVASKVKSLTVMGSIPVNLNIHGIALFTHPNTEVVLHDEIDDIDIVTRKQLKNFIKQIVKDEKQQNKKSVHPPSHLGWLARIDRHEPLWSITIPDEVRANIHPGIRCSYCASFEVVIGELLMTCKCGGWESAEEAIVRTICEYGVLNMNKNLYPPDLLEFFDHQVSMKRIEEHLEKHFSPVW